MSKKNSNQPYVFTISIRRLKLYVGFSLLLFCCIATLASPPFDTDFMGRTVVFLYAAAPDGTLDSRRPVGTGFLIRVPHLHDGGMTFLLATARHLLDPEWLHCPTLHNPTVIYARVNTLNTSSSEKVRYIKLSLLSDRTPRWFKHTRNDIDAAVILFPATEDDFKTTDFRALPLSRLPTQEELRQLSIGDDIVSAGMLVNLQSTKRNYPVFKFGKISNIPAEDVQTECGGGPVDIVAWLIAANLVPGNSGSPIFYYPPFGEDGAIRSPGLQRLVLLGIQSSSVVPSDIAFMTPATYVFDIIESMNIADADLYRGKKKIE